MTVTSGTLLLETPGHRWVLGRGVPAWARAWHQVDDLAWSTSEAPKGVSLLLRTHLHTLIIGQAQTGNYQAWAFLPEIRYA